MKAHTDQWTRMHMQEHQEHTARKRVSSTNSVEKTGYLHAKGWNWTSILHQTHKSTKKEFDLSVRPESIKLLEDTRRKLYDFGLGNDFFGYDTESTSNKGKIGKWKPCFRATVFCKHPRTLPSDTASFWATSVSVGKKTERHKIKS